MLHPVTFFFRSLARFFRTIGRELRHLRLQRFYITMVLAIVVTAVQFVPGWGRLFELRSNLALQGEWWRYLTHVFSHSSNTHYGWNMFGVVIGGGVAEYLSRRRMMVCIGLYISVDTLHQVATLMPNYVITGYSGVASALFTFILVWLFMNYIQDKDWPAVIVTGVLIGTYVLHEAGFVGQGTFLEATTGLSVRDTPGKTFSMAHIIGIGVGLVCAVIPPYSWPDQTDPGRKYPQQ